MTRLFAMEDSVFKEMQQMLAQLRGEPCLSAAEQNLVVYLDGLLRVRRWSGDLQGFLPHLRALAEGRRHSGNEAK
jgi:hypothetical protein